MAETSPLINLDLVNQIYKVINAQIAERVYNPQYYTSATLGTLDHKYVSAYISGNTSTGTLNDLTLSKASTGFTISGGATSKTLTVADTATINKPLTVQADTSITGNLTVSAATNIIKNLTVGATATYTGAVTVRSRGTGNTVIAGPSGDTVNLIAGTYTTSATTSNSDTPTAGSLLKIGTVDAKKFLAGPASSSGTAAYRTIVASDLPVASASADGIVTTGAQTFEGTKTFNKTIAGSITGNAVTLSLASETTDVSRFIIFQSSDNDTSSLTACYDTDFKYNPVSNLMNVGSVQLNSKVTLQYNSSTESLDFTFA